MPTYRKVFRHDGPTTMTDLRGVMRRDFDHGAASLFRFARTEVDKAAPSCIQYGLVQTRFCSGSIGQILPSFFLLLWFGRGGQVRDLELFKDNHPILIAELARFFVVEIAATIAYFAIEAG